MYVGRWKWEGLLLLRGRGSCSASGGASGVTSGGTTSGGTSVDASGGTSDGDD